MLRLIRRSPYHIVSPIEVTLTNFLQGRPLSNATVSEFISNQKPKLDSVPDFVYIHKLAGQFCFEGPARAPRSREVMEYLKNSTRDFPLESVPSSALSVLISCLTESPVGPELLARAVHEMLTRDEPLTPRFLGRVCKGAAALISSGQPVLFLEDLSAVVDQNASQLTTSEISQVLEFCRVTGEICESLLNRIVRVAPLMPPSEAAGALTVLCSVNPRSPAHAAALSQLKLNVVRSEKPGRQLISVALASLGRIGAMTRSLSAILFKHGLDRMSAHDISVMAAGILTSPVAIEEDQRLNTHFVKFLNSELKSVVENASKGDLSTAVRAVYAGSNMTKLVSEETVKTLFERSTSSEACLSEETRTQIVEISLMFPQVAKSNELSSLIYDTVVAERAAMSSDPLVQAVMQHFKVTELSSWSDAGLPVIQVGETFIDIDLLSRATSRSVRAALASKEGLKYKVIDGLSWYSLETGRESAISEWMDEDKPFWNVTDVQSAKDMEKPEKSPTPFFTYVRKIDLR